MKNLRFLIGAGGTGGHLFPAIAVVERLMEINPKFEFYFTGRADKIEGEVIPKKSFNFIPIDIDGYKGISFDSFILPFKILKSVKKLNKLIKKEKIDAVICTGAYISFAPGIAAKKNNIPLFLLESNVNPGKTISMLANSANHIYTSYDKTSDYFNPKYLEKIIFTGNPLRKVFDNMIERKFAIEKLGLPIDNKTLFIFGGSLGAKSINEATIFNLKHLLSLHLNIIWQTGKNFIYDGEPHPNLRVFQFIDDMELCYAASDIVLSRSGATTVAELASIGKPSILVPLPSASNNEQFMNAKIFQDNNAAILIEDFNIKSKMLDTVKKLTQDDDLINSFSNNAKKLANPNAATDIANNILKYMNNYGK